MGLVLSLEGQADYSHWNVANGEEGHLGRSRVGKGTEAWPQLYSWWVSKEPPDTLTEQDLRPCWKGQRYEKPEVPTALASLLGSFYFRFQSQGSRKSLSSITAANDSLACWDT